MGIFSTNGKNYDQEIALLNKKQEELNQKQNLLDLNHNQLANTANKNKSDIVALGIDFTEYKEDIKNQLKDVWDFMKTLNADLSEFQKWQEEVRHEAQQTKKAKTSIPNTLTCEEVCKQLKGISYLSQTSFKYYLYEIGILDMKINRIHNTYKISSKFDASTSEIKQYIYVTDGVITFKNTVLDYITNHQEELNQSVIRYKRKQDQFNISKHNMSQQELKNLQDEIGRIVGTSKTNSYSEDKWNAIYSRYQKDHPNFWDQYNSYVKLYKKEHPKATYKPTTISYLVQEARDGDVLLKIACELFVN